MPRRGKIFALLLAVLIVIFAAGCEPEQAVTGQPPQVSPAEKQPSPPAAEKTMQVTVYFATKDAMYLVPETRTVPKSDKPIEAAVAELLGEPKNAALVRALPAGTKLKGITVKDHIAYVDFNDKLVKGHGGSAGEILAVGAIVNTVTEFADIYKVQIMVEGKKVATLYGHLDTSEPLSRSEKIVKKTL